MALRPALLLLVLGLLPLLSLALGDGGQQGDLQARPGKEGLQVEQDLVGEVVKREADPRRNPNRPKKSKKCKKGQKGCKRKKNNRPGRRGRNGRGKGQRRLKKGEKCDKACRQKRRRQQQRKRTNLGRRKSAGKIGGRQATNLTSCVLKFAKYTRLIESRATHIVRQVTRIYGNDKVQVAKGKKKGDFDKTKGLLLAALGGNKTAMKCDGKDFPDETATTPAAAAGTTAAAAVGTTARSGFRALTRASAKDAMDTLEACPAKIEAACSKGVSLDLTLKAKLDKCNASAAEFKAALFTCTGAGNGFLANSDVNVDDACKCVEEISTTDVATIISEDCKTVGKNNDALAAKKACKKTVGDCKKAEAMAVEGIDTCKEKKSCGGKGVKDKASAEAALKVLAPLSDALANPAFANALKEAALNTGAGDDGKVPAGSGRQARAATTAKPDGAGCTAVGNLWGDFNTSASKTAKTADAELNDAAAKETTDILDNINGRSTLVADLKSCAPDGSRLSITITIIKIRFYIFWCGWFQVSVIEVKITIITVSFGVTRPPPVLATTAAPQVTAAAAGSTAAAAAGSAASTAAAAAAASTVASASTAGGSTVSAGPAASTVASASTAGGSTASAGPTVSAASTAAASTGASTGASTSTAAAAGK